MIDTSSFLGLVQNASLLLAVAFLFDVVASRWHIGQSSFQQALVGLAIGIIGITVMQTPWTFGPGIVFDTRSVLIGISGLFFGSVSTAIAMAMTAALRFYQGGTGAWTGIAVIITSGAIGIAWRHFRRRPLAEISWRELYLFGMVIHLSMLGLMLTLPWTAALRVLSNIALPVILIYPLGTALLGVLMVNRLRRKQEGEALRESELKYRTLIEATHDFVFMVNRKGLFAYVNPNFEQVTGYPLSEVKGHPFTVVISPDERETIIGRFKKGVRGAPSLPYETELLNKGGKRVAVEFLTSNLCDSNGNVTGRFGVGRDITKRKEMEALLKDSEKRYRELSIIDDLTQLYNSRYFYDQLKMEIARVDRHGQPLTLLLLDLDDFKQFNDAYGHVEGDQVLSRIGQVVKRCLRQTDSAYRYGGEEFTILLPMTTSKDAVATAERIRTEFKKETFSPAPGQDVYVTVSIGLGQYKPQEDMKAFVHRVDQLMYQAKKNGKDMIYSEL